MIAIAASLLLAASVLLAAGPLDAEIVPTCGGLPATIVGTNGADLLIGTDGVDVIIGFGGNDVIHGFGSDDVLCGGPGSDVLAGGSGADEIIGGRGADTIRGESGDDVLRGGPGQDRIYGDFADGSGDGNDRIFGGIHKDVISGAAGDDIIFGGDGPDEVLGEDGADELNGTSGNDILVGGPGSDIAKGHKGIDECSAETANCEKLIPYVATADVANDDGRLAIHTSIEHTESVAAVDVALKNGKLGTWVQDDGTLGETKVWHAATVVDVLGATSYWSTDVTVPRGNYSMSVRATDVDGDKGRLRPRPFFKVRVTGLEVGVIVSGNLFNFGELRTLPPGTTLGRSPRDHWGNPVPANGAGDTLRIGGAAYDGTSSVSYVEAAIRDTATGMWLQPDGSFDATPIRHEADCPHCIGTPTVFWLFDAELSDGDYEFHGYGLNFGRIDVAEIVWPFAVDGSVAETPQVAVDQPDHTVFDNEPVAFSGSATDNIGVLRVEYSILDRATGLWLCGVEQNPWEERKCGHWTELASPNSAATLWTFEHAVELPPGSYRLSVAVFDELLHRNSISPWLFFEVT